MSPSRTADAAAATILISAAVAKTIFAHRGTVPEISPGKSYVPVSVWASVGDTRFKAR
jgi:hypothetical protein